MKRKIRHALVTYRVEEGGKTNFETAFRNQIVDIPDDQVERLDALGATVDPDAVLERPGAMTRLSETASDSDIMNWVMGATNDEVEELVRERPVMAGRIESAHASIMERFDEQNIHLGGLKEIAEEAQAGADIKAAEQMFASWSEDDVQILADLQGLSDDEILGLAELKQIADAKAVDELIGGPLTDDDADRIVAGKASDVADYISQNPASANIILSAEGRRATAKNEDVRVTVTKAAEAAAGFAQ